MRIRRESFIMGDLDKFKIYMNDQPNYKPNYTSPNLFMCSFMRSHFTVNPISS